MNGYALWELISDYSYVIITVVGVMIVLGLVYGNRQRAIEAYKRRAQSDGIRDTERRHREED